MAKSQEPQQAVTGVNVALPPLDEEMRTPTPREAKLAELAKKNAEIAPQRYDITSKNKAALRVVYDHNGRSVTIGPGDTKRGVLLHPATVANLRRGSSDLEISDSSDSA